MHTGGFCSHGQYFIHSYSVRKIIMYGNIGQSNIHDKNNYVALYKSILLPYFQGGY